MGLYQGLPRGTSAPFDLVVVSLVASTEKTVLQIATPSTTDVQIYGWGVSFDGTSGTGTPVKCQLVQTDTAATVTALTPELWMSDLDQASLCVGGTALTGYNASAEGTVGAVRQFDGQHVHPQSGYAVWFPADARPKMPASKFLRVRCTAAAAVDVLPWVVWREPVG